VDGLICRSCRAPVEPGDLICPTCNANLTATRAVMTPGPEPEPPADLRCPDCGASLEPDAVLCTGCLRPVHRQLVVELADAGWRYTLGPGARLLLGRDPATSPAAGALTPFDSVSRRHAELVAGADGTLTVTDLDSTNGTFVDGVRLPAGGSRPLPAGSTLRLASTATFRITAG